MTKTVRRKLSFQESLARRREQKKLSMRRAREKLKDDPIKHEERKSKDRLRYEKNKQVGKIKTISERSSREQRQVRKGWKKRAQQYRDRKWIQKQRDVFIEASSPPQSPVGLPEEHAEPSTSRKDSGKKIARKNRYLKNKQIKELEEKLKKANIKVAKYKQRLHRLNKKNNLNEETPRKKVCNMLKGQKVDHEVHRKILFGEVISRQMTENFKKQKSKLNRNRFRENITGKMIEKYQFVDYMRSLTSRRLLKKKNYHQKKIIESELKKARKEVISFLERDECSRLTPGKKDTITRGKIKKQKRLLNDTLKNLHSQFISENQPYNKMSYSMFCKLRPFWIIFPHVASRDTCACRIHSNMSLVVLKLRHLKVINYNTPDKIAKLLCCPGNLKENCLERNCERCKDNQIDFNEFDGLEKTTYDKWVIKKVHIMIKGKEKISQKTVKECIECTKYELVQVLQITIYPFMEHVSNIVHQHKMIHQIKDDLSNEEVLLHSDFSENYSCKYSQEVQSLHFGGSRAQITLHTSVFYYKNTDEQLKHKNFCSISESLRHDAAAICAHLCAVIEDIKKFSPNLKRIHFLTDGPSTQYRNKNMFYLMATYLSDKFKVDEIKWHYSEAGHGKGAPDGIGGCLKRMADDKVSKGVDVQNYEKLANILKESKVDIKILEVTESNIIAIDEVLSNVTLKPFKGTMKVHEISWTKEKPAVISARRLTCKQCKSGANCKHYGIGLINLPLLERILLNFYNII